MTLNDAAVRVGITGHVFEAPVGTAMPTTVTAPLPAPWREVGLISEDALTEGLEVEKEVLPAWQRPTGVRTITKKVTWTWQFQAMESSPLVLDLFYGGAPTTVNAGVAKTTIPVLPENTERAWVVETEDGDVITRYCIPKGDITERGEVPHKGTAGTYYDMTVTVLGTSLASLGERLTNDPIFLAT